MSNRVMSDGVCIGILVLFAVHVWGLIEDSQAKAQEGKKEEVVIMADKKDLGFEDAQLQSLAEQWVQAQRDVKETKLAFEDAQGKMTNAKNRSVELTEKLKTAAAARVGPTGTNLSIGVSNSQVGVVIVEKGRVFEPEKKTIIGLSAQPTDLDKEAK